LRLPASVTRRRAKRGAADAAVHLRVSAPPR